jgi:hypothetical protein
VKQGCEYEQQKYKFFDIDYLESLQLLEASAQVDPNMTTFKNALKTFVAGGSASIIKGLLTKVPRLKAAITGK